MEVGLVLEAGVPSGLGFELALRLEWRLWPLYVRKVSR